MTILASSFLGQGAHALEVIGTANERVNPVISQDGRFVIFESDSAASGHQIYKRDTIANTTMLISSGRDPQISADGRFVTFESTSAFFPDSDHQQIYLKDTQTGLLSFISKPQLPVPVNHDGPPIPDFPVVSNDGKRVYFQSNSPYLVPHGDVVYRIYEKNVDTGTVRIVSTAADGTPANSASMMASLDPSNRFLFFESTATNLAADSQGYQIFRKDLVTGEIKLVSSNAQGKVADGSCAGASTALGGNQVAFVCQASNLVSTFSDAQVYVKDLMTEKIEWVASGLTYPVLSQDGSSITYLSRTGEVARKDLKTGSTLRLISSVPFFVFEKISLSADSAHLVFSAYSGDNSSFSEIWKADVAKDFQP